MNTTAVFSKAFDFNIGQTFTFLSACCELTWTFAPCGVNENHIMFIIIVGMWTFICLTQTKFLSVMFLIVSSRIYSRNNIRYLSIPDIIYILQFCQVYTNQDFLCTNCCSLGSRSQIAKFNWKTYLYDAGVSVIELLDISLKSIRNCKHQDISYQFRKSLKWYRWIDELLVEHTKIDNIQDYVHEITDYQTCNENDSVLNFQRNLRDYTLVIHDSRTNAHKAFEWSLQYGTYNVLSMFDLIAFLLLLLTSGFIGEVSVLNRIDESLTRTEQAVPMLRLGRQDKYRLWKPSCMYFIQTHLVHGNNSRWRFQ